MYDLLAISDANKGTMVGLGTVICGMLTAILRWLLRNEHRVTDLERSLEDAKCQITELKADIAALRKRGDDYLIGKGPGSGE